MTIRFELKTNNTLRIEVSNISESLYKFLKTKVVVVAKNHTIIGSAKVKHLIISMDSNGKDPVSIIIPEGLERQKRRLTYASEGKTELKFKNESSMCKTAEAILVAFADLNSKARKFFGLKNNLFFIKLEG